MPPLLHNIILSQPPLIQRSLGSNKRTRGIKPPTPPHSHTHTQRKRKKLTHIQIVIRYLLTCFGRHNTFYSNFYAVMSYFRNLYLDDKGIGHKKKEEILAK
jgi:hypothetical protein